MLAIQSVTMCCVTNTHNAWCPTHPSVSYHLRGSGILEWPSWVPLAQGLYDVNWDCKASLGPEGLPAGWLPGLAVGGGSPLRALCCLSPGSLLCWAVRVFYTVAAGLLQMRDPGQGAR